ncbi:hypothetical protein K402DRAFT_414160 [Aulographum hederae CBS 113979]|uniref:Protein BNI4 n=1 Tax=Aulographum hederae CBS 113979 TaxID=1176131 RepID=A0A6G1GT89_9PEZI|nr:hypothetical protein K402DRAFT_414160 [Aulographum hederae CBS 113979]
MLHSSQESYSSNSSGQPHTQSARLPQMPRSHVFGSNTNGVIGHRGLSSGPVAPYAFQSTPHLRQDNRTSSAPGNPYPTYSHGNQSFTKVGQPSSPSASTTSSSSSSRNSLPAQQQSSKDDSIIATRERKSSKAASLPASAIVLSSSTPDLTLPFETTVKSTPNRYRPVHRRTDSNNSSPILPPLSQSTQGTPLFGPVLPATARYENKSSDPSYINNGAHLRRPSVDNSAHFRKNSADDTQVSRQSTTDQAKRYRRRSLGSFDNMPGGLPPQPSPTAAAAGWSPTVAPRREMTHTLGPAPTHVRKESSSSTVRPSSPRVVPIVRPSSVCSVSVSKSHSPHILMPPVIPAVSIISLESMIFQALPLTQVTNHPVADVSGACFANSSQGRAESQTSIKATSQRSQSPVRQQNATGSTSRGAPEASKRMATPSPLSKPVESESPQKPTWSQVAAKGLAQSAAKPAEPVSKAVAQLTAVSDKDNKKSKSRLRRAFSFGSAQELRKASAQNITTERERQRTEKPELELEPEDAAIAAQQEAAGIGNSIYSGQGNVFSSSTDNISISSTASSASMMLRKMGQGMKKSTRSIKGLFRPKSVVGVPAADGPFVQPSTAQVSMVTVEAEREKVNVNADPHTQVGGGTGFPKLERNSLDAASISTFDKPSSSQGQASNDAWARKSIVSNEKERAEVLAAVKKGILKRGQSNLEASVSMTYSKIGSNTNSPTPPATYENYNLPNIPHVSDSPTSSGFTTPVDERRAQDYFEGPRFATRSTRSLPTTPHGSRNISFSPRIQFHDAWSANEYDRRGDIATCNRLTPMLAQQIKEELNSFKMEMEVHELSKPHTHFF